LACSGGVFDWGIAEKRLAELNALSERPDFWNDPVKAQPMMRERTRIESAMNDIRTLEREADDAETLWEMAEAEADKGTLAEVEASIRAAVEKAKQAELKALLSGEVDANDCYIEVNAGAGGTESQDWASMLRRMYVRYANAHGMKVEEIDEHAGETAGIKSATMLIKGENAYGWLKSESGVHRLVRISPYDSNARRHTSFASVWVYPVIDDTIEVNIRTRTFAHTYRAGRRRSAHQQDRLGGSPHAHSDRHRRGRAGRAIAAQEPRPGVGHATRAHLRDGIEEARSRRAGRGRLQDRDRLGQADPLLCSASLSDGEGPPTGVETSDTAAFSTAISMVP
jgi:hypothetical protein